METTHVYHFSLSFYEIYWHARCVPFSVIRFSSRKNDRFLCLKESILCFETLSTLINNCNTEFLRYGIREEKHPAQRSVFTEKSMKFSGELHKNGVGTFYEAYKDLPRKSKQAKITEKGRAEE